jgi:hypothetical protein
MKITQDKLSTKLLMRFIKKQNLVVMTDTWNHFGEVSVRIVSVGETDKWNWVDQKYSRVLNIEVTAKKKGFSFSEDRIPSNHYWSQSRMSFFKRRKSHADWCFNKLIKNTIIPTFFKVACIPGPTHNNNEYMGNVTFKYID